MANTVENIFDGILKQSNKKIHKKYNTIHQILTNTPKTYFILFVLVELIKEVGNDGIISINVYHFFKEHWLSTGASYIDWYTPENLITWSCNQIEPREAAVISSKWNLYCQKKICN